MSPPRYLSIERLISINARFGGTVISMEGLQAAAHRPKSGFSNVEAFPTLWNKAAAYFHGIASPQHFTQFNKRTAWVAANLFLEMNGIVLPPIPDVEVETFAYAVALNVFNTDEDRDRTLKVAAEWFESKYDTQRYGAAQQPRLEYAFLASYCGEPADRMDGIIELDNVGLSGFIVREVDVPVMFPLKPTFYVVGRYHFSPGSTDPTITVTVVPPLGGKRINRSQIIHRVGRIAPSSQARHSRTGLRPLLFWIQMNPVFLEEVAATVTIDVDGVRCAELPYQVGIVRATPNDVSQLLQL